ncbi:MAG: hypothetical protein AAGF12_19970 [Myxococcota bacterium]
MLLVLWGCQGTVGGNEGVPPPEQTEPPILPPRSDDAGPPVVQDAGTTGPTDADAGEDAPDASPPPTGTIGAFLIAGGGGRVLTSCDDGEEWHEYVTSTALIGDEHSPFTVKGFASGDRRHVLVMGWGGGGPGSVQRSTNGFSWTREGFAPCEDHCAGLAFDGSHFVLVNAYGDAYRSRDGVRWDFAGTSPVFGDRPLARFVASGSGVIVMGGDNPPSVSRDGGSTWEPTGCGAMSFGGVGRHGGVAFGAGTTVIVGMNGRVCSSSDGRTWSRGPTLEVAVDTGGVAFADGQFWMLDGTQAFVSPDGAAWRRHPWPGALALHQLVADPVTGTMVGFDWDDNTVYRSTNAGDTWNEVARYPATNGLVRIVTGHVPAAECP